VSTEKVTISASVIAGKLDVSDSQKLYLAETMRRWGTGPVSLTVKRERAAKSTLQLGYYNALVLPMIVEHICGDAEDEEQTRQLHTWLKSKFLAPVKQEITDQETGEIREVELVASLADANTKEMTDFVDRVRQWAGEFHGLTIPDPDPEWKQKRGVAA
jgi:hypothetical protein